MRKLPKAFEKFSEDFPDVFKAYEQLGAACRSQGPLDAKTRELVKLGIAVGAKMEGATHSHTRRALEAGAKPEEIRHVIITGPDDNWISFYDGRSQLGGRCSEGGEQK